jgi:hypothetical protein
MNRRWRFDQDTLPILLVGGGSGFPAVGEALGDPVLRLQRLRGQPVVRLEISDELVPGPGMTLDELTRGREFLLVAEGLSYPEAFHPRQRMPREVPHTPPPDVLPRFRAEDMYD